MQKDNAILKDVLVKGFGTLIIREFFLKLFSFVGQIFLARLLFPSDFGIYVIIVFIINSLSFFSDIGLSHAIIQKKENPTKEEISSIFGLKVILSISLIFLIWVISPVIKLFYLSFTDGNILMVNFFSFTLFFSAVRAIPIALLERKLQYNLISIIDIVGVLVYYAVALIAAFFKMGVWSFIMGALVKELIETIILYKINPFVISFRINIVRIKKLIKFGIFVQGNSLVLFFGSSIIPVIGGRISGPYAVGLLDFANSLASLPEIVAVNFGRVAFASYSRIQEKKDLLFKMINKSISLLSVMIYIFPILIISFGKEVIDLVYTERWGEAISALYWFGLSSLFQPILAALGQGILSIGKSQHIFRVTFAISIFAWIFSFILINRIGFISLAIINFLTSFALTLSYIYIFGKNGYSFPFRSIVLPKIIVVVLTTLIFWIVNIFTPSLSLFLGIKIAFCFVVYILLMMLFSKSDVLELLNIFKHLMKK